MSEYKGDSNDFNVAFLSSNMESSHNSPSQQVPQLKDISNEDITLDPYLEIVEQPQNRFRFRYRSELNVPHGCIFGESYVSTNIEIHPMVQLLNYEGKATIRCGLAQIDNDEDHPHKITERDQYERISAIVPEKGSYRVAFPGLTIIHTPRRDVENLLAKAYCRDKNIKNVTPEIRRQCKIDAKRINLNIVRLKFSAHDVNTGAEICPPAFSQTINNLKSAATNNLRICRMSRMYGSPRGGDDVFIFVEKVSRNDIQVRFFELSKDDEELWSANGRFSRCDVHYQYGMVFSTPPYWDTNIATDVTVHIQLVRPSDDSVSNLMDFTYRGTPHSINRNPGTSSNYSWYEEYRTEYRYLFELPEGGTEQSSSEQSTSTSSLQFSLPNFNRMQIEYEVYCKRNNLMPFNFTGHEEQTMEIEPTEQTSLTLETVYSPLVMDKMMQTVLKLFNDLKYLKKPIEIDDTQFMKIRGTLEGIFETTLTNGEKFLHMMMLEDLPCFFNHTIKLIKSVNLSHLLNRGNDRGQTILHLTTFNNFQFLIPFLIREGCDPMIGDLAGNNALHHVVMYRDRDTLMVLKILLKTIKHFKVKFDLNAYNEEKRTPLHLVALRGLLHATYLLLEEGACVNTPDASGRTPLHLAVARDSPLLVAAILRHSKLVDVDVVDGTGYTALHIACENNKHPDIVKVLLKYKADPMKKVHNQTAWKMASKPIRNLMQKYTEKTETSEDTSDEETSSEESVDHSCKETRLIDDYVLMSCDH